MDKEIKSGKEVIDEFFSEIYNIENVDEKTVKALVSLYSEGKLTDKNIQNALEVLVQQELTPQKKENEQN
jgi:Glu-tRNA(Gln) amidotransferase subunit E-like FAD-binding protein